MESPSATDDSVGPRNKLVETPFTSGHREGVQTVCFLDGRLKERVHYSENRPQRIESFYQNGGKKAEVAVEYDGPGQRVVYHYKHFDDSGRVKEEGASVARFRYHPGIANQGQGDPYHPVTDDYETSSPVGEYVAYHPSADMVEERGA